MSRCTHDRTVFARRGPHVAQLCRVCGANTRGPGRWVALAELRQRGIDAEQLPTCEAVQAEIDARQPTLFGEGAG